MDPQALHTIHPYQKIKTLNRKEDLEYSQARFVLHGQVAPDFCPGQLIGALV